MGTVAAGAHDIDEVLRVLHRNLGREFPHHLRGGGDLAYGLLFHAQADDDRRHHERRHFPAHDPAHEIEHFVVEYLAVLDDPRQRFEVGDAHDASLESSKKFFSIACPCSVSTDSG